MSLPGTQQVQGILTATGIFDKTFKGTVHFQYFYHCLLKKLPGDIQFLWD